MIESYGYRMVQGKLEKFNGFGICYCHSHNIGIFGAEELHTVKDNSYCPDFIRRKLTKGKLEDWIKSVTEENNKKLTNGKG